MRPAMPIPATVILRAVDEKLFAMGAASAGRSDRRAVRPPRHGAGRHLRIASSSPGASGGEGGDTTGGGGDERVQFKDALLFASVDTDAKGRGSVSFKVSDDLTSWRVSASAITAGLDAGAGSVLVPVGLPFFADASIAPEYLRRRPPVDPRPGVRVGCHAR